MFRTEDIIDEITQWIDSNLHKPLKIEDVVAQQDTRGGIFSEALYRKKELMLVITTPFNFDPYLDNMNHQHKCIVVSRNELSISLKLVLFNIL